MPRPTDGPPDGNMLRYVFFAQKHSNQNRIWPEDNVHHVFDIRYAPKSYHLKPHVAERGEMKILESHHHQSLKLSSYIVCYLLFFHISYRCK